MSGLLKLGCPPVDDLSFQNFLTSVSIADNSEFWVVPRLGKDNIVIPKFSYSLSSNYVPIPSYDTYESLTQSKKDACSIAHIYCTEVILTTSLVLLLKNQKKFS